MAERSEKGLLGAGNVVLGSESRHVQFVKIY